MITINGHVNNYIQCTSDLLIALLAIHHTDMPIPSQKSDKCPSSKSEMILLAVEVTISNNMMLN